MTKEVMNAQELADYLGLAESTVYKKVEHRQIPFTKVGTLLRFPKWIIDRWLTERVVHPDRGLYEEFERLHRRYHLEQLLKARGVDPAALTEDQLLDELRQAIAELKAQLEAGSE